MHSKIIHNQFQASQPLQKKRKSSKQKCIEQATNNTLKRFWFKKYASHNLEAPIGKNFWVKNFTEYLELTLYFYGYAIIRAVVSRTATGLHSALGIHHHNQYNPFCLADDLNCYCTLENNSYFLLTGVQLYVASFKKKLCKESKNFTIPSFLKL